eukprot:5447673-Ditylum_brightwellii.AAC.1
MASKKNTNYIAKYLKGTVKHKMAKHKIIINNSQDKQKESRQTQLHATRHTGSAITEYYSTQSL